MNRKLFYVFLVCAFMALLVITVGGCGGSSNSNRPNSSISGEEGESGGEEGYNQETERSAIMVSAINEKNLEGSDIAHLVREFVLISGLNGDGEQLNGVEEDPLAVLSDMAAKGGAVFLDYSSFSANNIENVKEAYEAGAAIVMIYCTQEQIDFLFDELGVEGGSIIPEGSNSPYNELVAVKKNDSGTSIYVMPHAANLAVSSDITNNSALTSDELKEKDDFNRERLQRVVDWIKGGETESTSVKASDITDQEDLTKLSTVTRFTLDFSYKDPKADDHGKKNFYNMIAYDVYSCHSFETGKDYFVIEMNSQANPKKEAVHEVITAERKISGRNIMCLLDSAVGYIKSMKFANDIDVNAFLVDSKPVTQKTDVSSKQERIEYNFGNLVAYKPVGHGRYFPEFNNVIYQKDLFHSVNGFELNASDTTWDITFPLPADGEEVEDTTASASYQKVEPTESSVSSRRERMIYIYEIDRDEIRDNGNEVTLSTTVTSEHGCTEGNAYNVDPDEHDYLLPRSDTTWYKSVKNAQIKLPLPPTVGISVSVIYTGRASGANAFQILSDSDWTIDTQADWITASPSSGKATNTQAESIIITYLANETSSTRATDILIRNSSGETVKLPFYQATN